MKEKTKRNWLLVLGMVLAGGPVVVMMVNFPLGLVLLVPGAIGALAITYRLREGAVGGGLPGGRSGPRTIYVPLVDDDGNDLDAAETERRLAEARLRAHPGDKVVGVLHKVA
jgi:hypothetical protein